jgi:hypothetical protein
MASGTVHIVEPVSCNRGHSRAGCVALYTHDGAVSTGQRESHGLMFGEGEGGRHEALYRMAGLALAGTGRLTELPRMLVHMTLGATGVGNLIDHSRRPGSMALIAAQPDMLSFQGEAGCPMPGHVESGRLESLHLVTGRTLSSISPTGKLVFVRALPVTIAAEVMGYRQFEIALQMARLAWQSSMLPGEREPAARMIEHR